MYTASDEVKSTCNIMLICGDEKQSKNSKWLAVLKVFRFQFKSCFLNLEFVVYETVRAFEVKKNVMRAVECF